MYRSFCVRSAMKYVDVDDVLVAFIFVYGGLIHRSICFVCGVCVLCVACFVCFVCVVLFVLFLY